MLSMHGAAIGNIKKARFLSFLKNRSLCAALSRVIGIALSSAASWKDAWVSESRKFGLIRLELANCYFPVRFGLETARLSFWETRPTAR